jgi:outer membrane biosynthesis protein TonB
MMNRPEEDPRRPGRGPVLSSVALHLVAVVVAWWAQSMAGTPLEYVAYEMDIMTFADLEELEDFTVAEPDLVVETPEEVVPPEPQPEPEPEPPPDPEPEPVEPEPQPEPEPEPEPRPREETPPQPERPPERPPEEAREEVTSAEIVARMEGLRRDYPAYYDQIQREIFRCFRPPAGVDRATTVVRFEISRDGRVPGASIRLHQRSGDSRFDIQAVAAVECAGGGRFGPLPSELPYDVLPVQFTFSPRGFQE